MSDDLPRFAVTREFLTRYGDDTSVWLSAVCYVLLHVFLFLAVAERMPGALSAVAVGLAVYGVIVFFLSGFFWALWSDLLDHARERDADAE